jgi:exonuclease III
MSNYKLASINVRGKLSIAHQVKNLERYITTKDFDIITIQESNLLPKDKATFAHQLRTVCFITTLNDKGNTITKPEELKACVKEKLINRFQRAPIHNLSDNLV